MMQPCCSVIDMHQNKHGGRKRKIAFDRWEYKHHFDFIWFRSRNIGVWCLLCAGNKMLSTAEIFQLLCFR